MSARATPRIVLSRNVRKSTAHTAASAVRRLMRSSSDGGRGGAVRRLRRRAEAGGDEGDERMADVRRSDDVRSLRRAGDGHADPAVRVAPVPQVGKLADAGLPQAGVDGEGRAGSR